MKNHLMDMCLTRLVDLRERPVSVLMSSGYLDGFIEALFHTQEINIEEFHKLKYLSCSAFAFSGRPFPNRLNGGPLMPSWVANSRNREAANA